ncbi:histidine--tRNA ligase [[Mycoplasma] falconis]|uniref:Histidine--tRNA ligase n=1 Tax=[Mycoplasma] falconis TaxID=92403 RepID=A0A501XAW0_9BACT|nr:histidine--tRNA ligase [[Mycoplasma] falconis]TPE57434.1 histidine--tRNA ligase [[Mycoplasma] falconis]
MFNRLKGTKDIYGLELKVVNYIKEMFFNVSKKYNCEEIQTPIIEDINLFIRSVGETSDIVSKEMYAFEDLGGRKIALRPEGTASAIRAFCENRINNMEWGRFSYFGPMFRYERPQKGRYRQFLQGGIELIENKSSYTNLEIIKLAVDFLEAIKVKDYILQINNLGSFETRNKYISELKKYFENYKDQLNEISKIRLEKNVLRILDDKEEIQKEFVKNAPKLLDFLSSEEKQDFQDLLNLLEKFNINYQINPYLVRGLDYYNDIVFEFVSNSEALGSQSTILAGGRYDGMIKEFGGPDIGSIGFAFGVDRLSEIITFNIDNYEELLEDNSILIGWQNEEDKDFILKVAYEIRKEFNVKLINKQISIKNLFKNQFKFKPKYLIFKELNTKEKELKVKTSEKEFIFEYNDIEDFKKAIKE